MTTIIVTRNGLSDVPSWSMPARTMPAGQAVDEDVADRGDGGGDVLPEPGGQLGQPEAECGADSARNGGTPTDVDVRGHPHTHVLRRRTVRIEFSSVSQAQPPA